MIHLNYTKVRAEYDIEGFFTRTVSCPRGREGDCKSCPHVKLQLQDDRGDEFRCLDLDLTDVEVRTYLSPFIFKGKHLSDTTAAVVTHRESILAEARLPIEVVEQAFSFKEFCAKIQDLSHLFIHQLMERITTGEIVLHYQEAKKKLTK